MNYFCSRDNLTSRKLSLDRKGPNKKRHMQEEWTAALFSRAKPENKRTIDQWENECIDGGWSMTWNTMQPFKRMTSIHASYHEGISTTYCWLTKAIWRDAYNEFHFCKTMTWKNALQCMFIHDYMHWEIRRNIHLVVKNHKREGGLKNKDLRFHEKKKITQHISYII